MKKFLLFVLCISLNTYIQAQCSPDPNYSDDLVYPTNDSTFNAIVDEPFEVLITLNVPSDTSVGPLTATIDSVVLSSVSGIPPGLTYECHNAECFSLGGESGCLDYTEHQFKKEPLQLNLRLTFIPIFFP